MMVDTWTTWHLVTAGQVSLVNTHVLYRPISLQSKHIHI